MLVPYRINEIDLNNIIFKKIKESKNKKIIFIKYNDNKVNNFVFQLPTLNNNIEITNTNQFEINLDCINKNKEESLLTFLNNLDDKIIHESKNNTNWFDHLVDKSFIKYQRIIKDNNYHNGCINFKIINNDDLKTKLVLNDDEIDIYNIPNNNGLCKIMLECYAIWINECNFGLLLRPIIISFKIKLVYNYKFINDSDTEEDTIFIKNEHNNIINLNLNLSNSETSEN